jgi:hypothetical protein
MPVSALNDIVVFDLALFVVPCPAIGELKIRTG